MELYGKGKDGDAEKVILNELTLTEERSKRATLYNDLGYIRSGIKKRDAYELARKDLETAFDLHYSHLPLTLLNLGFLDLEEGDYLKAIGKIEDALLLTTSPIEAKAAYLRFKLAESTLGFKATCEETPANIIEIAYMDLSYCFLKAKGYDEAVAVIREGIQLFPSSIRLKHCLARLFIHKKRLDLALPIYWEISESRYPRKDIQFELRHFARQIAKYKKENR